MAWAAEQLNAQSDSWMGYRAVNIVVEPPVNCRVAERSMVRAPSGRGKKRLLHHKRKPESVQTPAGSELQPVGADCSVIAARWYTELLAETKLGC